MNTLVRTLEQFTDADRTRGTLFSRASFEASSVQDLRAPQAESPGAGYAYDLLERGRARKAPGDETVRYLLYERAATWSELDEAWGSVESPFWGEWGLGASERVDHLRALLREVGLGKLWTLQPAGDRLWAWARAVRMPEVQATRLSVAGAQPVIVQFRRQSDWRGEDLEEGNASVAAAETSVTITNPGNAPVRDAVLELAGTYTNPTVRNATTGESVATTRDGAAASDVLRIDAGRYAVEFSDDGGESFADDYELVTLGATQVALLTLEPGDNKIEVEDGVASSATLSWSFYPAYH